MSGQVSRKNRRLKVHRRVRAKVQGTASRPRLCVFRSLNHMYAQLVDDEVGRTIASASTVKLGGKRMKNGSNIPAAAQTGQELAEKALEKGVKTVVFDRSGYIYHGRVKALADAARKAGLKF